MKRKSNNLLSFLLILLAILVVFFLINEMNGRKYTQSVWAYFHPTLEQKLDGNWSAKDIQFTAHFDTKHAQYSGTTMGEL